MNSLFSSDSALTVGNVFEALPALTSEYIASLGASDVWLDSGTGTTMLDAHPTNDNNNRRWIGSGNEHLQGPSETIDKRGRGYSCEFCTELVAWERRPTFEPEAGH